MLVANLEIISMCENFQTLISILANLIMDDFDICDDALLTLSDNHQIEYTCTCVCAVLAGGCGSIGEELGAYRVTTFIELNNPKLTLYLLPGIGRWRYNARYSSPIAHFRKKNPNNIEIPADKYNFISHCQLSASLFIITSG